jgi:hypothetical protein
MWQGLSLVHLADQIGGISESTLYNNTDDLRAEAAVLDSDAEHDINN